MRRSKTSRWPAANRCFENVILQLPVEQQQVEVSDDATGVSTTADANANAVVIKGKDLDALSDDPDELQNELQALAGPAAGPNGGQIYIDGFTGGQLPPKSSIREIRINQNPFSARVRQAGLRAHRDPDQARHGQAAWQHYDFGKRFDIQFAEPVCDQGACVLYAVHDGQAGRLHGIEDLSWFGSVFRRDNASNSIVNAELLDSNNNVYNYTTAVANPQSRLDVSPRFDFQLGSERYGDGPLHVRPARCRPTTACRSLRSNRRATTCRIFEQRSSSATRRSSRKAW